MKVSSPIHLSLPKISYGKTTFFLGSLIAGQWAMNDIFHMPSGAFGCLAAGAGVWLLMRPSRNKFNSPTTVNGWIKRCNEVLDQFKLLEDPKLNVISNQKRTESLNSILDRDQTQEIVLLSTSKANNHKLNQINQSIIQLNTVKFSDLHTLPVNRQVNQLPNKFLSKDIILYSLPLPLKAIDLIWLQQIPEDQPAWILASCAESDLWTEQLHALQSQLPKRWTDRILKLDSFNNERKNTLAPIKSFLNDSKKNIDITQKRLLSQLHSSWQSELEKIRRDKFKSIQSRSQWIVAGAVFASPVPSTDLLSLAVVNGLMVHEMSQIWSCNLSPDLLKAVAKQLTLVALSQGVVEWSGQALLSLSKLHGGSWIAAGTIQALSAAYLTRIVGRSMSDWMAINNGVNHFDLETLKYQAPALVENAAKLEKIDWTSFLSQSRKWMKNGNQSNTLLFSS